MTAADGQSQTDWMGFKHRLADVTQIPADEISSDTQLVSGLGLDSLALAELVMALRESYESPARQIQLEGRNWQTITVGQLFEEFTGNRVPARSRFGSA